MQIRFLLNEENIQPTVEDSFATLPAEASARKRAKVVKDTPVELSEKQNTQQILSEPLSVPAEARSRINEASTEEGARIPTMNIFNNHTLAYLDRGTVSEIPLKSTFSEGNLIKVLSAQNLPALPNLLVELKNTCLGIKKEQDRRFVYLVVRNSNCEKKYYVNEFSGKNVKAKAKDFSYHWAYANQGIIFYFESINFGTSEVETRQFLYVSEEDYLKFRSNFFMVNIFQEPFRVSDEVFRSLSYPRPIQQTLPHVQAPSIYNIIVEGTGEYYNEKNPIHILLGHEEINDSALKTRLYSGTHHNCSIEYVAGNIELDNQATLPLPKSLPKDYKVVKGTSQLYNEKNPIHQLLGCEEITKTNLKKRCSEARTNEKNNKLKIEFLAGKTELYDNNNVAHQGKDKETYVFTSELAMTRAIGKISTLPAPSTKETALFTQGIFSPVTNICTTTTTSTVSSHGLFSMRQAAQTLEEEILENAKTSEFKGI